jgi:hypothetical protein
MALRTEIQQATTVGTYYDLMAGGSNGSEGIVVSMAAPGTITTVGKVRLWVWNGTHRRLLKEFIEQALTSDDDEAGWNHTYFNTTLELRSPTWKLQAEITVANTIDFVTTTNDR